MLFFLLVEQSEDVMILKYTEKPLTLNQSI